MTIPQSEEFQKLKESIIKEKERIEKIYERDIGIKWTELFEESENSISSQMDYYLKTYYSGHYPFYYYVQTFHTGTQILFDKLKDQHLAVKELFDRLSKIGDEMITAMVQYEEQPKPKEKEVEVIEEVSEARQKELIDKVKRAKTRGEQLNLLSKNARRLHDVNASDQKWMSNYMSQNRLWMLTPGNKKIDDSHIKTTNDNQDDNE